MGRRGLCTGIIAGAAVGGLVSLLNQDTRNYVKSSSSKVLDKASYYTSNPDEAIDNLKSTVTTVNKLVSSNTDSALNVLNQVDGTVKKFLK